MATLTKERMKEWAGELKGMYEDAQTNSELAECADAMADFIDDFLSMEW